jgi:hypothetical protein
MRDSDYRRSRKAWQIMRRQARQFRNTLKEDYASC